MAGERTRFRYGDSATFSMEFNVLETLLGLVYCVRQVGTEYFAVERMREQLRDQEASRDNICGDLSRFAVEGRIGLMATAHESPWAAVHGHAEEAVDLIETAVKRWQAWYGQLNERDRHNLQLQVRDRESRMRAALESFLVNYEFEVDSWEFGAHLSGGNMVVTLQWTIPEEITVSYELSNTGGGWATPIRVADLVPHFEIEVGLKKKLLGNALVPNRQTLDDFTVVGVRCSETQARLEVAKKASGPGDRYEIQLQRKDGALRAAVHRSGSQDPTRSCPVEDLPRMQALWIALQGRTADASRYRKGLRWVRLGGRDALDADAMLRLAERFVAYFRPIVHEIAKHSPNEYELSLKIDVGQGRREELYIERAVMAEQLLAMPKPMLEQLAFVELLPPGSLPDESPLIDLRQITQTADAGRTHTINQGNAVGPADGNDGWVFEELFVDDTGAIDLTDEAVPAGDNVSQIEELPTKVSSGRRQTGPGR